MLSQLAEYKPDGTIIWISPLLAQTLEIDDHLMVAGEKIQSFLPPPVQAEFEKTLNSIVDDPENSYFVIDIPVNQGRVTLRTCHFPDDDEEKGFVIKIVADIPLT